MFPTLNMSHISPPLMATTAFFENMMVCARALGRASLAKMIPAMQAEMMTPDTDWTHIRITTRGHSSVVAREPYLRVNICG